MESAKMKGKVQWFNARKGYGYIAPDEGGKDIYVHFTGIQMQGYKTLKAADVVEFDLQTEGPHCTKGPIAINVVVLQSSPEEN